jgi:(E)-4-hydroxy-3-methylbut-2-enyl-diphosphate synthase
MTNSKTGFPELYTRLATKEVSVGGLLLGNFNPIRVQTMTTTDTNDTLATVEQSIRCIEAGAELVRITAPSKTEAENLLAIKNELHKRGYHTPLVADIHFTPNAAEIAARIVEKVRVNPGNYVDKKKFDFIDYTDAAYTAEIERIRDRFTPLVKICKEYGTAMRIGTNHGSLSDRIMSRYGDTPMGMVESAMEFLRIARAESYHNIVLSMKSSNPQVMVQAYRLLVKLMQEEFNECYPLHLGVTEAGDGEDGRIKSAIGIGTLLQDGMGDTIRVSLTEDPEFEIPVCKDLINSIAAVAHNNAPFSLGGEAGYSRRHSATAGNTGGKQVPVVVADVMLHESITPDVCKWFGYTYDAATDKWHIADGAADYVYTGNKIVPFALPGTLQVICDYDTWLAAPDKQKYHPLISAAAYTTLAISGAGLHFISIDSTSGVTGAFYNRLQNDPRAVLCAWSSATNPMQQLRGFINALTQKNIHCPVILAAESQHAAIDEQLIHFSINAGGLLLDGLGDGVWLMNDPAKITNEKISGRTYLETKHNLQFLNNTAFSILQATRTRISKTEYISCPSCGRTLFDLQETTAKIRAVTNHLKGVKIAIMGCIVNGPGEMADADFGYVGSGPGKITLYKGKEVVKRNVNSEVAVDELIQLLKESEAWVEHIN